MHFEPPKSEQAIDTSAGVALPQLGRIGRTRNGEDAHTLGGTALVLLLVSIVLGAFLSRVVDGRIVVVATGGTTHFLDRGTNVGGYVSVLLIAVAAVLSLLAIARSRLRIRLDRAFGALLLLAIGWWGLCSIVLRRDAVDQQNLPYVVVALLLALAVAVSPPTLATLRVVNVVRDATVGLMFVAWAYDPAHGALPCRPDKCGVFGNMLTGFLFTENSAAQLVVLLVPAALAVRSRLYLAASLALSVLFVAATGSRTSLLGLFVTVGVVLIQRRAVHSGGRPFVPRILGALPLVMLLVSLVLVTAFSGAQLTDRGVIYAAIMQQMSGYALLVGSGPDTMHRAFELGLLGHFEAVGEHGQAGHLLVQTGLVGVALFCAAFLTLVLTRKPWSPPLVISLAFTVSASMQFLTEPGWTFNLRSLPFVGMLLAIGLCRSVLGTGHGDARPDRSGVLAKAEDDRSDTDERTQAVPVAR